MEHEHHYSKYVMIIFFILICIFTVWILLPFISSIIGSLLIAYIFYPVYKKLNAKLKAPTLSAFLLSLILILLLTVPLFFMVNSVTKEVFVLYTIGEQKINAFFQSDILDVNSPTGIKLIYYVRDNLDTVRNALVDWSTSFVFSIPNRVIEAIIMLFTSFYLFRDGDKLVRVARNTLTLKAKYERPLTKQMSEVIYALIYGSLVIAIIEGFLGGFAFWLFGIPSPIFWGIVMTVLAFLPIVGAGAIWAPAAIMLIINGSTTAGILLILYGLLFISSIDILVKPKVIGSRANVHPVLILLGVLGGLATFGLVGFVVGPLILALLTTFLEIYRKERGY